MKRIDLHLHSTKSDGTQTIDEIIHAAKEDGLSLIAITDHNKISVESKFVQEGITVIPGCEFSTTYWLDSRKKFTEIHVVGLFEKVNAKDFDNLFQYIEEGKLKYVKAILDGLENRGIHITLDEVLHVERKCDFIGRHQVAQLLINKGYVKDMNDAFDNHVGNFSPYYIPSTDYIKFADLKTVVEQIQKYNGIPILAHPYGYELNKEEIEVLVKTYKEIAGYKAGMEVYYEVYKNEKDKLDHLIQLSKQYDLLPSASSDRHTKNEEFATMGDIELYNNMLKRLSE